MKCNQHLSQDLYQRVVGSGAEGIRASEKQDEVEWGQTGRDWAVPI